MTIGFYERARRDYGRRVIREQVEVVSLVGSIALDRDEPRLHAHVVVGRSDGTVLGGHLLGGRVDPTLEAILVEPRARSGAGATRPPVWPCWMSTGRGRIWPVPRAARGMPKFRR